MIRTFSFFYLGSVLLLLLAYVIATRSWYDPNRTIEVGYNFAGEEAHLVPFCEELLGIPPYQSIQAKQAEFDRAKTQKQMIAHGVPVAKGAYFYPPIIADDWMRSESSARSSVSFLMDNSVANHRAFNATVLEALQKYKEAGKPIYSVTQSSHTETSPLEWYTSARYRSFGLLERRDWEVSETGEMVCHYSSHLSIAWLQFDPRTQTADPFGNPYPRLPAWTPRGFGWSWEGRAWRLAFPLAFFLAVPAYLLRKPLARALSLRQRFQPRTKAEP